MLLLVTVIAILLQVADYWTTRVAIESGKGSEGNKIVKWFMDKLGLRAGLIAMKLVGIALLLALYFIGYWLVFIPVIVFYAIVVYNNYLIFKRN